MMQSNWTIMPKGEGWPLGTRRIAFLFLQELIDLSKEKDRQKEVMTQEDESRKLFFICTERCLKESEGEWTVNEQKNYLPKLQQAGFIEIIGRGIPRKRWVHVRLDRIERATKASRSS